MNIIQVIQYQNWELLGCKLSLPLELIANELWIELDFGNPVDRKVYRRKAM